MNLIDEFNPETAVPRFDLYGRTAVQKTTEKTIEREIRPIAQLNTGGHIEFYIENSENDFLILNQTTLYVKFRVKLSKNDNAAIVASDWNNVSIVNNFLHALWSQVDLTLCDNQVTSSLQTYPYRSYLETIIGTTPHSRKTHSELPLFFEDISVTSDTPDSTLRDIIKHKDGDGTSVNTGKVVEMEGRLHLDLLMQDRVLIGNTRLKIRLVPNRPQFYFMCSDSNLTPSIFFEDVRLHLDNSIVSQHLVEAHEEAIRLSPSKYIINRSEVRSFTIDSGATTRSIENVIQGQLPRRVYIAFIANDAFSGSYKKNPYNFIHSNINYLACQIDGVEMFPKRAYTPDFTQGLYAREYKELFKVSEQFDNDARMMITKQKFGNGFTIFAFNLSDDLTQGYHSVGYVNQRKFGRLRVILGFSQPLTSPINAVILCEFDNQISINEDRIAMIDAR